MNGENDMNTKNTKRIEKAEQKTAEQLKKTADAIKEATEKDTIVNTLARQAMKDCIAFGINSDEFGKTLQVLACVLAHSRLNVMLSSDKTYNAMFYDLKRDITACGNHNKYLQTLESLVVKKWNKKKQVFVYEYSDKKQAGEIIKKLAQSASANGSDLVSVIVLYFLEYLSKIPESKYTENTLLDAFEIYDTNSQTYRNGNVKAVELWTKRNTNSVKQASAACSKAINESRAIREQNALYTALEINLSEDENGNDTGIDETRTVYKRVSAFSGYDITDINGKFVTTVTNETRQAEFISAVGKLNLSDRERQVFEYCYLGKRHIVYDVEKLVDAKTGKAIVKFTHNEKTYKDAKTGKTVKVYSEKPISLLEFADRFYLDIETVKTLNRRLLDKVYASGILSGYLTDIRAEQTEQREKRNKTARAVNAFKILADGTKEFIACFESMGKAAKILNVDKGNISRVIHGKLNSENGFFFAYA